MKIAFITAEKHRVPFRISLDSVLDSDSLYLLNFLELAIEYADDFSIQDIQMLFRRAVGNITDGVLE